MFFCVNPLQFLETYVMVAWGSEFRGLGFRGLGGFRISVPRSGATAHVNL